MNTSEYIASQTSLQLEGEEWRKVPYLPPHIEISSMGRLRMYTTPTDMKLIKPTNSDGYLTFSYSRNSYVVHRVVADVFLDDVKVEGKPFVRHKNGIKDDNRVENLEWCSPEANFAKTGGWGCDSRKKLYCEDLDAVYGTLRSAAYLLRIPQDVLSEMIKRGKPCCGHTFRYIEGDDPMLLNHNIYYIDFESVLNIAEDALDADMLFTEIIHKAGDGIKRPTLANMR